MTKITITKSKSGEYKKISCKGHAGYAQSGSDIVCSAVSMLVINTINSLELLTNTQPVVTGNEEKGMINCSFIDVPDAGGKLLLDSMVLGLENVISEYGSKYLKLNFKEV